MIPLDICSSVAFVHQHPILQLYTLKCVLELEDETIISCSTDTTVKRWSRAGSLLNCYVGHLRGVYGVVELDSCTIVTGSSDCQFKVWNIHTSECLRTINVDTAVYALILLRDRTTIVSNHAGGWYKMWRTTDFECFRKFPSPRTNGRAVCLRELKNGDIVSVEQSDVHIWTRDGILKTTFKGHKADVLQVIELQDNKLASGSIDGIIKIWDDTTGSCSSITGSIERIVGLAELSNGFIISVSWDLTLRIWDINKERCMVSFTRPIGRVTMTQKLRDGSILLGESSGSIKIWKLIPRTLLNLCCKKIASLVDVHQLEGVIPRELMEGCLNFVKMTTTQ
eukprot:TRINITY_DN7719_c0_g1_i1.p1 TRINITY_DN7719_c0_g1~~TRINITY_DN7719_c0_g1_i1.p1  ORF type:complete len:338 (-),score=35.79 TRINITY_DN7719_c0_g1_i1:18-1031(-)